MEIYAPTILPPKDVFLRWPKDQRADYIYQKLGGYHQSKAAGVPRDKDGLWEFANRPVHHYLTLSREVQALMRLGLMNPEKSAHPMHLTVGGVTSDGPAGAEADILARSLEATGWCSSSSRMLKPATGKESWIQKGDAGIKERERDEIALSGTRAIEIRTMEHQGLGKLDRSLRSIYALGSALRAYQGITEGRAPSSDDEQALADVWREFSSRSNQLFTDQGLDSPTGQRWTGYIDPEDGIKMDGNFYQFGQLLKDAEADPQSPGGRFQDAMQDLVISARKEALAILERTAKAE